VRVSIHLAAMATSLLRLSQDEGINLEGIRRILSIQDDIDESGVW
jgi:hypothetical protein